VPFLVIGERVLIGSEAIARSLPHAVQDGLAAGGIAAPALPEGLAALAARAPQQSTGSAEVCGAEPTACAPASPAD